MLIFTHFELGDSLVCNAIVRHYSSLCENVEIFVRKKYIESIKFMYRDLSNIIINPLENRNDFNDKKEEYFKAVDIYKNYDKEKINLSSFNDQWKFVSNKSFDVSYYLLANLQPKDKYKFRVVRDFKRETALKQKLNLSSKYVFVHDDKNREFEIHTKFDLPILRPSENDTDNIFDWLTVIENAQEIHCINSAFLHLIDLVLETKTKLFFYHTIRPENKKFHSITTPNLKLDWNFI